MYIVHNAIMKIIVWLHMHISVEINVAIKLPNAEMMQIYRLISLMMLYVEPCISILIASINA